MIHHVLHVVLHPRVPSVVELVLDFEKAVWKAAGHEMPRVTLKGCVFHWAQALWRKVQDIGLQTAYTGNSSVRKFIRRLLALPFLPAQEIQSMFYHLQGKGTTARLRELTDYIEVTWITSRLWPVEVWCVYGQAVRTNNDVEGWHHRLNVRAGKPKLPFYLLLILLYREARLISLQAHLISDERLRQYKKKAYRQLNGKLFSVWNEYQRGNISVGQLLRTGAHYHNALIRYEVNEDTS